MRYTVAVREQHHLEPGSTMLLSFRCGWIGHVGPQECGPAWSWSCSVPQSGWDCGAAQALAFGAASRLRTVGGSAVEPCEQARTGSHFNPVAICSGTEPPIRAALPRTGTSDHRRRFGGPGARRRDVSARCCRAGNQTAMAAGLSGRP